MKRRTGVRARTFLGAREAGSLPEQLAAADLVAAFDKVHRQKAITQEDLADLGEKIKAFQATWVSSWDILNGPSMVKFATSIQTMADALMRKKNSGAAWDDRETDG